jgi:hypothetical protein
MYIKTYTASRKKKKGLPGANKYERQTAQRTNPLAVPSFWMRLPAAVAEAAVDFEARLSREEDRETRDTRSFSSVAKSKSA